MTDGRYLPKLAILMARDLLETVFGNGRLWLLS